MDRFDDMIESIEREFNGVMDKLHSVGSKLLASEKQKKAAQEQLKECEAILQEIKNKQDKSQITKEVLIDYKVKAEESKIGQELAELKKAYANQQAEKKVLE